MNMFERAFRVAVWTAAMLLAACVTPDPNKAASVRAQTAARDPTCLHDTGSMIVDAHHPCRGIGRSYTREQIDQTGATTAAEALRQLDPAVQVRP